MASKEINFPDFNKPPINEVVLGVQFRNPVNFQHIQTYEVWNIFRDKFPVVDEQAPLPPQFETFGLPGGGQGQFSFNLIDAAAPGRYWFLTNSGDQLLQFQPDRLLHNWRKVGTGENDYPRFENIIEDFRAELAALESYFHGLNKDRLHVTQAEISYINHILLPPHGSVRLQDWLSIYSDDAPPVDELNSNARTVLQRDGVPVSRFHRESGIGLSPKGRILWLSFTVRGLPKGGLIGEAIDFIEAGRKTIADEFIRITTEKAQKIWERTQ